MTGLATILRRRKARVRVSANTGRRRLAVFALLALILAVGTSAIFLGAASAEPVMLVDDDGPDDEPGQKDLNFLTVDYAPSADRDDRPPVWLGRHRHDGREQPGRLCALRHATQTASRTTRSA